MKPTKILKVILSNKGNVQNCFCDDGHWHLPRHLAKMVGIQPASFRGRLKNWGYDHPDILNPDGRKDKMLTSNIMIDITDGDLEGKYQGRTSSAEQRRLLDKISGPGSFEGQL